MGCSPTWPAWLFYLIGPFMGFGTKMEPLLALGVAAVWAIYGGIYFMRSSKTKGRTTLVDRPLPDSIQLTLTRVWFSIAMGAGHEPARFVVS